MCIVQHSVKSYQIMVMIPQSRQLLPVAKLLNPRRRSQRKLHVISRRLDRYQALPLLIVLQEEKRNSNKYQ
ncbi:hypothetical protein MT325_m490L [Paramecium bursaria chlorella virus MT325]|uniref:Uncharacterized protein m490L n=1 Tax=Paramecium bursaria Chlorella virus MT325 TaxID=346932 RepID=A7IUM0_PBCVM|nr:hypothetical protein MT325_m490L [Paramecium bursaria chlorella virus MT325]